MSILLSKELGKTHQEIAEELHVSRSMVSMVETGKRKYPEECEPTIARMCFKAALKIANERTGGYISNLLNYEPNVDLHPAALKERLLYEIEEAVSALEGLKLAKRMDPKIKKQRIEEALMELEDVADVINVMKGAYSLEFGIDIRSLNQKRKDMIERGER